MPFCVPAGIARWRSRGISTRATDGEEIDREAEEIGAVPEESPPEDKGSDRFVKIAVIVASLGGLLFGYDTGVISGAILFVKKTFNLSSSMQEMVVSAVLMGAVIGAAIGGVLADHFGRRKMIILAGVVFTAGALGTAVAPSEGLLIAGRIVVGWAIGVASFISPMYMSEISPARIRGSLVSINQLAVTVGIVIAYLAIGCLAVYVASFAIGLGPIFWLMISEIYPQRVRGEAMSLATVANWGANLLVALTFLSLVGWIGRPGTFWIYGGIGVLSWLFIYALAPETKGRSLEQIQEHWRQGKHPREMGASDQKEDTGKNAGQRQPKAEGKRKSQGPKRKSRNHRGKSRQRRKRPPGRRKGGRQRRPPAGGVYPVRYD